MADKIKEKQVEKKAVPQEQIPIVENEIKDLRAKLEASMKEWKEKLDE